METIKFENNVPTDQGRTQIDLTISFAGKMRVPRPSYHNTDLCMDVKTYLRRDTVAQPGKRYRGVLVRDDDSHYTFVEAAPTTVGKRNPHVFVGLYITATRRDDGSLRLNFKPLRMDDDFDVWDYADGVAREIVKAVDVMHNA